jgi:DNA polymerase III epsilon subunit-like protein
MNPDDFFWFGARRLKGDGESGGEGDGRARGRKWGRDDGGTCSSDDERLGDDGGTRPLRPRRRSPLEAPAPSPLATLRGRKGPVLVFDTETTGFTKKDYVLQLAWAAVSDQGKREVEESKIVQIPFDMLVPKRSTEIHRLTTRDVRERGVPPVPVIEQFLRDCARVQDAGGRVVAHNAPFDVRLINQTLRRQGASFECDVDVFCLQKHTRVHSPLLDKRGRRKPFKNEELHEFLFGERPSGKLHDALVDVGVTLRNYDECCRRGWFA